MKRIRENKTEDTKAPKPVPIPTDKSKATELVPSLPLPVPAPALALPFALVDLVPGAEYIRLKYKSQMDDDLSGEALLRLDSVPDKKERDDLFEEIVDNEHLGKYIVEHVKGTGEADDFVEEDNLLDLKTAIKKLKGEWSFPDDEDLENVKIVGKYTCNGAY